MPNGKNHSGNGDTTQPRRPFYKRKRWIAAGVLWLVLPVLYVAAEGPAMYCYGRGWLSPEVINAVYRPLFAASEVLPPTIAELRREWRDYWLLPAVRTESE